METFTYKKIQLTCVDDRPAYSVRLDPYAVLPALAESIAKQGVIMPLVVTCGERPVILAGHRRFAAARLAGYPEIPVLEMQNEITPRQAYLAAVISNWGMSWEDADRAYGLGRGVGEFGLSPEEAAVTLLPAMGLEPQKHVFDEYYETAQLEPALLKAIYEKRLPYRGARHLSRFSKIDQNAFAELIAGRVSLSTQDFLNVQEWLRDLMRQSGRGLEATLAALGSEPILSHEVWDRRMKGDKFIQMVRAAAHPALTAQEVRWAETLKSRPDFTGAVKVEAPQFFEEQGYQLRAKLKNKEDLERYRQLLEKHGEWLNSLFDLML